MARKIEYPYLATAQAARELFDPFLDLLVIGVVQFHHFEPKLPEGRRHIRSIVDGIAERVSTVHGIPNDEGAAPFTRRHCYHWGLWHMRARRRRGGWRVGGGGLRHG